MSSSKFLPFQDVDGDGLNDVCKDEIRVVEEKVCPRCVPNPNATVPNWRLRKNFQPFLNEKICEYQVTFTTPLATTKYVAGSSEEDAQEALNNIYVEYEQAAIEILLRVYNRDSSEGSIELLRSVIKYADYDLEPRPGSRLKLLYSVPFENLDALPYAEPEEDTEPSPIEVTYVADDIGSMLLKVRKGLNLYDRYLRMYRKLESSNIYFRDGDKVFNLDLYGDFGFGKTSLLQDIGQQLDDFMRSNGYNINGLGSFKDDVFPGFYGGDTITEITFGFTEGYRLQKILFYTEGCLTKPIVFAEKCEELRQQPAWKDPTAVSYFAKLPDMINDLTAREPIPWVDFLINYTYPAIYASTALSFEESAASCIAGALAEEGKQLGEDILDEVFSLGDAIAYKFHENLCKAGQLDRTEERQQLYLELISNIESSDESRTFNLRPIGEGGGTITFEGSDSPSSAEILRQLDFLTEEEIAQLISIDDPNTKTNEARGNAYAMAMEQAYMTLKDGGQPFTKLCAYILNRRMSGRDSRFNERLSKLSSCIQGNNNKSNSPTNQELHNLYEFGGLNDLLNCGLFDFAMEGITCLFNGLTLEEALSGMIDRAFKAMSIDNFGKLFVGLPYETQQELDALVKSKLENGDIFPDGSAAQDYSDSIAEGEGQEQTTWEKPWQNEEGFVDKTKAYFNVSDEEENSRTRTTRTLAQSYDSEASETLNNSVIMQAYFEALIEYYSDNLLDLVDELNKFPGAPLIAEIITLLDCPRPPLFQPSIAEFIKDIDLPFCRNVDPLVFPKFNNPFDWIPKLKDILKILFETIKCQLQLLIIDIISKLIVKLCELIGNAICNALALTGDLVASIPDLVTGKDNIRNVIRESICGEDASDEQIDETIAQLVAQLGVGGAALANQQQAISFMEDISSSLTYAELTQALSGRPTEQTLDIIDSIIEYEYPDYRSAMPNTASIGSFFGNIGNLMPASFRKTMQDYLANLEDSDTPANPSICLDPQRLQEFKDLRCTLLEGRASPEQCSEMFCSMREQMADDLSDIAALSDFDNIGDYLASQMPPMVSEPGCEDGLLPFEPSPTVDTVTAALSGDLEQLKVEYSTDMLGNGPGKKNWGMVNMMLSDTMGTPLTTHIRKAATQPQYVDYYNQQDPADVLGSLLATGGNPLVAFELMRSNIYNQRGAFPTKVSAYLQQQMSEIAGSISVNINNEAQDDIVNFVSLAAMDSQGGKDYKIIGSGRSNNKSYTIDILEIPDVGYNVDIDVNTSEDGYVNTIEFTEKARKSNPDLEISFYDNARGLRSLEGSEYSYGFDVQAFFSDVTKDDSGVISNIMNDNMRIKIIERVNLNAHKDAKKDALSDPGIANLFDDEGDYDSSAKETKTGFFNRGPSVLTTNKHEFLSIDETLNSLTPSNQPIEEFLANYPEFLDCFDTLKDFSPQTYLLKEIISKNSNNEGGFQGSLQNISNFQNGTTKSFMSKIFYDVADMEAEIEKSAWNYGAQYETLTVEDLQYGINNGGEWIPYFETEYTNQDMILGISYDQYKNEIAGTPENTRVFFLDPTDYGGNYVLPPFYIKPLKRVGWMGLADILFPDISPCKPHSTDLVDFEEIADFVNEIYPSIPEDERLKSDPDCIIELPYNKIMERSAKAGMFGLVKASIRMYVSAHFIKALPTFAKFKPDFPQVFSSAYASFIVEEMQSAFLDAQGGDADFFQVFKDSEFWYGFLEQCVQTYSYLVDIGKVDPPETVLQALLRLNDMQEEYDYPDSEDYKSAVETGETRGSLFESFGLKRYRKQKNLEAIRQTEEDAKIVMKEMVISELNFMSNKMMKKFNRVGLSPEIKNTAYYVLENFTQGTSLTLNSALNVDGSFKAVYGGLPTIPWEDNPDFTDDYYYTNGGELVVEEDNDQSGLSVGQEYVGYYHVHLDEETGIPIYMAGPVHTPDDPHDVLKPIANVVSVLIGNVASLDSFTVEDNSDMPFVLEKYIKVGSGTYSPEQAYEVVQNNEDLTMLISDVYPGTMELVTDENNNPVGVEGELGLRYGLKLSLVIGGVKYELTTAEIDALDTQLQDFAKLEGDSKLLLCLINELINGDIFKLVTRYVIPFPKLLSISAIYNDLGMLPSIGEITVDKGETFAFSGVGFDVAGKPGVQAIAETEEVTNADGTTVEIVSDVKVGPISQIDKITSVESVEATAPDGAWAHVDDRNRFTPFYLEWDDWDQILLRNSTGEIKKQFKNYYNSADFGTDSETLLDFLRGLKLLPGALAFRRLKDVLMPAATNRLVPWWMKGRLRANPFNDNDEMCKRDDE